MIATLPYIEERYREFNELINDKYGRHISITQRLTEEQKQQQQDNTPKYHKVAIVTFICIETCCM